jgi:acyl-CoA thioesterase
VTQPHPWDAGAPDGRHIWRTLGYRFTESDEGRITIEWNAPTDYTFPNAGRTIVHGGMVTTLLDTAMGHACLARLGPDESFLTADLHVDFYRAATPGTLRAEAEVRHQSRRAMFCEATLYDSEGVLLASARCTQIVRRSE